MSPKLPVVSGEDLIRVLEKLGYLRVRQKGSHVRMRHATDMQRIPVTIPLHKEIAFGTLRRILRDTRISPEELSARLG
jgi:predicted RNA binding protein YcfA (HicA-like mRNA interferase family)